MKKFSHPFGYEFYLDDSWSELTAEQRAKFNIPNRYLNYLVNYQEQKEFFVNFDHFSENIDELEAFFSLCKTTMELHGVEIINETKFVGISMVGNGQMKAYCTFSKMPNGNLQTTYFMRLSGKTPKGYLYGCLTTNATKPHDENDCWLVTAITNWKYLDVEE